MVQAAGVGGLNSRTPSSGVLASLRSSFSTLKAQLRIPKFVPIGRVPATRKGDVDIESKAKPDENEKIAGKVFAEHGYDVKHLATASDKGIHGQRTADLEVKGIGRVDVYTPKSLTSKTISKSIEKKDGQAPSIVIQGDISNVNMYSTVNRVWGKPGAKQIETIFFQKSNGTLIRFDRP